jgi:hypothetical protein
MVDCDDNGDEVLTHCEIFACYVRIENEYREANCPDYALAVCATPDYDCPPICDIWNCSEIE